MTLDGRTLDLTDSRGNEVEPFTIDGTTYLPLASISKALGMDVRWDADTNTVILNTKGTGTTAAESYIGVERAKEIALKDAGLNESTQKIVFTREELNRNSGKPCYILEFYTAKKQYSYKVDAKDGSIMEAYHFILLAEAKKIRKEEHTSELQSQSEISYAVYCLKKKKR